MGIEKLTLIFCDICSQTYADGDCKTDNATIIRRQYKADGWINRGTKDYCPACAEEVLKDE